MHRGILCALAAAVLFGLSTPLAKLALGAAPPLLVAGLLYLGSGLGLATVWLFTRRAARPETPLRRADAPWLGGAILTGGVLAPALLLFGLFHSSASTVSLLLNLEAVATAAIAWIVFRENVNLRVGLGFACILLGGVVLTLPGTNGFDLSSGALLVAGACVCWGVDNNLTRRISGSDPAQIAMWKGLVAGATNTALAFAVGATLPTPATALGVGAIGFLGYGVSLMLFVIALRHLGTARTAAYFSIAPFVGAAFALILGQGHLDWTLALSGALMLLGAWLHVSERHAHEHVHEPMEHEHLHVHDEHHQHAHSPDDSGGEPHSHPHRHERLEHAHAHYPDLHHRHQH